MYSGRLIDELLETVERVEDHALLVAAFALRESVSNDSGSTHIYERMESEQRVAVA